jgi:hypothetical protein
MRLCSNVILGADKSDVPVRTHLAYDPIKLPGSGETGISLPPQAMSFSAQRLDSANLQSRPSGDQLVALLGEGTIPEIQESFLPSLRP